MADKYINATALLEQMPEVPHKGSLRRVLMQAPAADVAPVLHGKWVWDENGMDWGIGSWRCSGCHTRPETWWQGERSSPLNKSGHYYCPNCGAKMDGE